MHFDTVLDAMQWNAYTGFLSTRCLLNSRSEDCFMRCQSLYSFSHLYIEQQSFPGICDLCNGGICKSSSKRDSAKEEEGPLFGRFQISDFFWSLQPSNRNIGFKGPKEPSVDNRYNRSEIVCFELLRFFLLITHAKIQRWAWHQPKHMRWWTTGLYRAEFWFFGIPLFLSTYSFCRCGGI